jgi:hypothetical protein
MDVQVDFVVADETERVSAHFFYGIAYKAIAPTQKTIVFDDSTTVNGHY